MIAKRIIRNASPKRENEGNVAQYGLDMYYEIEKS